MLKNKGKSTAGMWLF